MYKPRQAWHSSTPDLSWSGKLGIFNNPQTDGYKCRYAICLLKGWFTHFGAIVSRHSPLLVKMWCGYNILHKVHIHNVFTSYSFISQCSSFLSLVHLKIEIIKHYLTMNFGKIYRLDAGIFYPSKLFSSINPLNMSRRRY